MATNLPRKYIDLIHQFSGEWTNWDSPISVHLGDFGTLDRNGEFIVDGNIYSDEFQQYLKGIKFSFNLNAYPAKFTEFDQNYTAFSSGVKREQLVIDKFVDVPGISSTCFKETWTFQDGKRGALLILISSHTVSIREVTLAELSKAERLEGKHLVTTVRICPAYLKLLSDKSEQTVSVAFCPPAPGVDVAKGEGAGWWTDAQSELLHRDTHPHGKSIFTPLFSLKQHRGSRWQDIYPTWEPLDEDGEEPVRNSTTQTYSVSRSTANSPTANSPTANSSTANSSTANSSTANSSTANSSTRNNDRRKFIDLVRKISGKYISLDPPIPVTVGAYGKLDENGEFNIDGNIYSDEFQKHLDENNFNFVARDYRPRLAEPDQDYIVVSSGVTKAQFDPDQLTNPAIRSASIKGTWKFREGKRGALIILLKPRTSFIPSEILTKLLNVELLKGKHLVTSALACPAYLIYLSNKAGESFSAAFCARTAGDVVNASVGGEWWVEDERALLRRASGPNGEYRFMPLFTLKQVLKRGLFNWRADEEQHTGEEYLWHDVYPNWKPLDEDGEELDD